MKTETGKWSKEKYARLARQAAAESCVLLKNDGEALPLLKGDRVAVFGRSAFYYYKSGLGSGGLVNTEYVTGILDALKDCEDIVLEDKVLNIYEDWIAQNPPDEGEGWGTTPWSQKEMPVTEELLNAAADADAALVIIGRTAGEDQDNHAGEGSYLLTEHERELIRQVCARFARTAVLLNVGNLIDMSWVQAYAPAAVMYVWQGGQEGGNGVADVLTGKVNPSGRLTDTIAKAIEDYPSSRNFGSPVKNIYAEDIYVGYRYFETFAKDRVLYPFGFGLSYTEFQIQAGLKAVEDDNIRVEAEVKNCGKREGKEVVQIYVQAPQGKLGKPSRVLAGFWKTQNLKPGESERRELVIEKNRFASYDDSGITGNPNCFILESGEYYIYVGNNVRSAECAGSFWCGGQVQKLCREACAPAESFERIKPAGSDAEQYAQGSEPVPLRGASCAERRGEQKQREIPGTGDVGIRLCDVMHGKAGMDDFVAQLSDEDLVCLFHGEGMCSPKVTPGTASAFGGVTPKLKAFGIPTACCADGPSGIRMDSGAKAFSLPNGTALGCTFHPKLAEELFEMLGGELLRNRIDVILGPGINIHRNPLNGRNFEYVSEDPLLTGELCAAQLRGLHKNRVSGCIKHFCANNQEAYRTEAEAVVSQRALREIYLKPFEIAVKEGGARAVMTTYGPVNRIWTAGNSDLCTSVLRGEWGFSGIVMTDWWAGANREGEKADKTNRAPMIQAQNDLYMCCADVEEELEKDYIRRLLQKKTVERWELQRNAKNILAFLLGTPAMLREAEGIDMGVREAEEGADVAANVPMLAWAASEQAMDIDETRIELSGDVIHFGLAAMPEGEYELCLEAGSALGGLAQLPVTLYVDNIVRHTFSFCGTEGKLTCKKTSLGTVIGKNHYIRLKRQGKGLDIRRITIAKCPEEKGVPIL